MSVDWGMSGLAHFRPASGAHAASLKAEAERLKKVKTAGPSHAVLRDPDAGSARVVRAYLAAGMAHLAEQSLRGAVVLRHRLEASAERLLAPVARARVEWSVQVL